MRVVAFLVTLTLAAGCAREHGSRAEERPVKELVTPLSESRPQVRDAASHGQRGGDGQGNGQGSGSGRGERRGECPVLVDGKLIGALRYHELSPNMLTTMFALDDGRQVQRFVFSEYLRSLGVPLARVRAVHLQGGQGRTSVISGEELRRVGDRLQIHFTRETSGRPTFKYPGVDLHANTAVDGIQAFAVYVDSVPPEYRHGQLYAAGQVVDGGIEAARLQLRGTRVYLDGKLLAALRRRELDGTPKALGALLAKLGIDPSSLRTAEFIAQDDVAARVQGDRLGQLSLAAARGQHGRLSIDGIAAGEPIEAIALYAKTSPSDRQRNIRAMGGLSPAESLFATSEY